MEQILENHHEIQSAVTNEKMTLSNINYQISDLQETIQAHERSIVGMHDTLAHEIIQMEKKEAEAMQKRNNNARLLLTATSHWDESKKAEAQFEKQREDFRLESQQFFAKANVSSTCSVIDERQKKLTADHLVKSELHAKTVEKTAQIQQLRFDMEIENRDIDLQLTNAESCLCALKKRKTSLAHKSEQNHHSAETQALKVHLAGIDSAVAAVRSKLFDAKRVLEAL